LSDSLAETAVLTASSRFYLAARAVLAVVVVVVTVTGVVEPTGLAPTAGLIALVSAGQAIAVGRWPGLLRRPVGLFALLAVDGLLLLSAIALVGSGWFVTACAAGFAALSGLLLGFAAAPVWAGQVLLTAAVGDVSPVPIGAGVAASAAGFLMVRQARRTAAVLAAAQRDAAALERARLARELHDSVAKTVHGMSLAAMALPGSVGRHPHLAVRLADAISSAAAAAERETRDLLAGMRLDNPNDDFRHTLGRLCDVWSSNSGIPVDPSISPVDPPVPVRYELVRIVQEALANIGQHARAGRVSVALHLQDGWLRLTVRDDGIGFVLPPDLSALSERDHHGLVGMAERARAVGGHLDVATRPGHGTVITVRLPA
jgi:signal transduction histidine kinase